MNPVKTLMLAISVLLCSLVLIIGLLLWQPDWFLRLPAAEAIHTQALAPSSLILDRRGQLLYEIIDPHAGSHRPAKLNEIPLALRQAIIATEDATFYRNPGVEPWAILRALWINWRSGKVLSGGSTITQQLARNLLLSSEERTTRSWQRKLREALLAYHLTRTLSKDEILELYLNETYFGNMAYGVETASRAYFGKPVAALDLAECALLAGLPQSPSAYNPLTNLSAAKARQKVVLDLMVKAGYIDEVQADLAFQEPLHFASTLFAIEAPHFCMMVRDELARQLGEERVRKGGLRVYTTLDLDLQRVTEAHVKRHLAYLNKPADGLPGHNVHNAAVVVLDAQDGAVRALVGSPDYFDGKINGAVNAALALRQPGSAIKPFTYAAAFARGYSPATMMVDARTAFLTREGTPYVPINYDYTFHGPVLLRQALACSYNVVAVKLLDQIGIEALVSTAHELGITTLSQPERQGLALTLGSCEVQLLQLTAAYMALANGGRRIAPYEIAYVEDSKGHVIYRATPEPPVQVLDKRVAYLVTDVLSDRQARVPTFGEGSALELPFPAAVKTGTTTEWRDNWTLGYTTQTVVGVWVGNANNEPMLNVSGVSGAAPIWNAVMQSAHRQPPEAFERPAGLVETIVCADSGLLPGAACPHRKQELFLAENVPARHCRMHQLVAFDAPADDEEAESELAPEGSLNRVATAWPDEALLWAEERGLYMPLETAVNSELAQPDSDPIFGGQEDAPIKERNLYLTSPDPNSAYRLAANVPADFQQLEISAFCAPDLRSQGVELWVDGQLWHRWAAAPYRVFWPLAPGVHEFYLQAMDAQGRTVRSVPIRIQVDGHSAQDSDRTVANAR